MRIILDLARLIRLPNLILIALTQYMMRYCIIGSLLEVNGFELQLGQSLFIILVGATLLVAAGGYIINDYFDTKADYINNPSTVIIGKNINRRTAIILHFVFTFAGIVLGAYLAYKVGNLVFGFIFPVVAITLWLYSTTYKHKIFWGNLIISVLTALVPFIVIVFEIIPLNEAYKQILRDYNTSFLFLLRWISIFSVFAFTLTFIRELVKDIEDFKGDSAIGSETLPVVIGIKYTKLIILIFIAAFIFSVIYLYLNHLMYLAGVKTDYFSLFYFAFLIVIPILYVFITLMIGDNKKIYSRASTIIKVVMFTGLMYSLVICHHLSTALK